MLCDEEPRKEDGYDFCHALLRSMLKNHSLKPEMADQILGSSDIESDKSDSGDMYGVGSNNYRKFKELCAIDPSFANYIRDSKIDLDSMNKLSEVERAQKIRKVTSLVSLRLAYRKARTVQVNKDILRSRKNPALYSGLPALFAVTEGNPRWFIGIMNNLLAEYKRTGKKVDKVYQTLEINKTINRFRALLKTISLTPSARYKDRGLLSILDTLGDKFFHNVVVNDFITEPAFSFTVDANADPFLYEAIGKGLNAGAFIYIADSENEGIFSSVKGKRFRLSYLLSPHYGLPLSIGRSTALSKALDVEKIPQQQLTLI